MPFNIVLKLPVIDAKTREIKIIDCDSIADAKKSGVAQEILEDIVQPSLIDVYDKLDEIEQDSLELAKELLEDEPVFDINGDEILAGDTVELIGYSGFMVGSKHVVSENYEIDGETIHAYNQNQLELVKLVPNKNRRIQLFKENGDEYHIR